MAQQVTVQSVGPADRDWVKAFVTEHWGADLVASQGVGHVPSALPGFIARVGGAPVGLLTYDPGAEAWEIVSVNNASGTPGVGSALLAAVEDAARAEGCRRLWLITTNDNIRALAFYQKRGYVLSALHCDSLAPARALKPWIPASAENGIPIRDEIELEKRL